MSALLELKETALIERKARRTKNSLTCATLLGAFETTSKRNGKPVSDQEVYSKIKKTININDENWALLLDPLRKQLIEDENIFLKTLLPTPLSQEELEAILNTLSPSNVGQAMKYLQCHYSGRFDGDKASSFAATLIQKKT